MEFIRYFTVSPTSLLRPMMIIKNFINKHLRKDAKFKSTPDTGVQFFDLLTSATFIAMTKHTCMR